MVSDLGLGELGSSDISSTPVDDAGPDDASRIAVEADLLEDIEEAKARDQWTEVLR